MSATSWRPPQRLRPIAIAVVRRSSGAELLLMEVRDDDGVLKGWRPVGGEIEFGERASDALRRELREELGLDVSEPTLLVVLENLYEHHGATGHEIVFVFEVELPDQAAYAREVFTFEDGGTLFARWVRLDSIGEAELFPLGLAKHLRAPKEAP